MAKIASGEWPPQHKLPTYKQLSQEIGVSIITIQQSVGALVKEGVLSRTHGVGVFVAQPRPMPKGNTIALLVPDIRHSFFSNLAHIIQSHAISRDFATLFFSLCDNHEKFAHAVALLQQQDLVGIISCNILTEQFAFQFSELLRASHEVVFVDGYSPEHDCIGTDNYLGVEMALNHLIGLGHERMAFAAGQVLTKAVRERIDAFQTILKDKGLPIEPPQVQVSTQKDDLAGEEVAYTLFALRHTPTAILCMNDLVARGIMRIARQQGFRCPEDLSVVGFDDQDFAQHLEPPLTTVRQPLVEIGHGAVELLLERLNRQASTNGNPRNIQLKPQFVARGSTAQCPRTSLEIV